MHKCIECELEVPIDETEGDLCLSCWEEFYTLAHQEERYQLHEMWNRIEAGLA